MSFSATAFVGFQSVPVVVFVGFVDVDGPFAFDPPAWSVFTEVDFGDGPFALEEPFVVVVVVEDALVFCAASTLTVSPAAASNAAGSATHLVIAPPVETVEQGTYPVPLWDCWA
jgi:hypothetical protein